MNYQSGIILRSQVGRELKSRQLVMVGEFELNVSGQSFLVAECRCCKGQTQIEIIEDGE